MGQGIGAAHIRVRTAVTDRRERQGNVSCGGDPVFGLPEESALDRGPCVLHVMPGHADQEVSVGGQWFPWRGGAEDQIEGSVADRPEVG